MPASDGAAGASARAEGERERAQEEQRRRDLGERRPILGRLALAVAGPSTAGATYLKGAVGEEKLGADLDAMTGDGLYVLHDRRRPRTTANIDHLAVAPGGAWVIDAKRYSWLITKSNRGGWFQTDLRLTVGSRDRTKLVYAVHKQMTDVQRIVANLGGATTVPVHGALCFIDAKFRLFANSFLIDGVLVTSSRALRTHGRGTTHRGRRSRVFECVSWLTRTSAPD